MGQEECSFARCVEMYVKNVVWVPLEVRFDFNRSLPIGCVSALQDIQ